MMHRREICGHQHDDATLATQISHLFGLIVAGFGRGTSRRPVPLLHIPTIMDQKPRSRARCPLP
jgi:hypothetical protein